MIVILFGKRVFTEVIKDFRTRSSCIVRAGPQSKAERPYKRKAEGDLGHRESREMMERIQLPTWEQLETPEAGGGQKGSAPEPSVERWLFYHLIWDFWPPEPGEKQFLSFEAN